MVKATPLYFVAMDCLSAASLHHFLCAIFLLIQPIHGALHHVLHHYQPLRRSDISHHVTSKRSIEYPERFVNKLLTVNMMNRQFTLDLSPRDDLFHPEFKVFSMDKHGRKKEHHINKRGFYTGHVRGIPDSTVKAHFDGEDLMAKIYTPEDTYSIEPSWRHISEPHDFTMIAYKTSHVKHNTSEIYCPSGHHLPKGLKYAKKKEKPSLKTEKQLYAPRTRTKRQAPVAHNTCPLLLTADSRFFDKMGLGSINISINYLISLVNRVDGIYKTTNWDTDNNDYSGFGFEIKEILIHETPHKGTDHYNSLKPEGEAWNVQELLEAYSKVDHSSFCLSHLFTYQDFEKGVLGLAYIGTSRANAVGGICTKVYPSAAGKQYLNTGLTTTLNWGRRVLTDEADLVTAHELGHNFGSEHDPGVDSSDCSPGKHGGGKYLMYPASVTGDDSNNDEFSECSKRLILPVLITKAPVCFKEKSETSWCGNYRIDGDEECDAGYNGKQDTDNCCDSLCRLKQNARCSDQNHACCYQCNFASSTTICRQAFEYDSDCTTTAYCTGVSSECPPSQPRRNDSSCIDNGLCRSGICVPFCESRDKGLVSCLCSGDSACFRCCRSSAPYSECEPYTNSSTGETLDVPVGRPCEEGVCVEGKCESRTQDLIARLFDVFEEININILRRILKDNVVGATIIISLLIWVPCSCIIHRFDRKRDAELDEVDNWLSYLNTDTVRPEDKPRVRSLLHWWDFQKQFTVQQSLEESL